MEIFKTASVFLETPALLYLFLGYSIGFFFGAVPGLTATLAISLLLPLTFSMAPVTALVTCVGIFVGGIYGGSVTGTLINIPGAPASAITTMEAYKLTRKGQAARAMGQGAFASMIGGFIGALLTLFLLGPIAELSLYFRTPDKFSLVFMAVVVAMLLNGESLLKGVIATGLGLMMGSVGLDYFSSAPRLTFGLATLTQGVQLLTVVVGTFAVSEILTQLNVRSLVTIDDSAGIGKARMKDFLPPKADLRQIGPINYLRSTLIGFVTGILPGAGASMASLMAYGVAKTCSKRRDEYGEGSIEGIAASEAANNAMCPGAIIPMMLFGIPGDSVTAIILGVFTIHGLIPGPLLLIERLDLLGPMLLAMLVTPLLIFFTAVLFGRHYLRILKIRKSFLYPFIAMAALVGLYAATYSVFQMVMTLCIGFAVYVLKNEGYPSVPFLLGFILGPLMETFFRSSLSISSGDLTVFLTSPFSLAFLIISALFLFIMGIYLPRKMETARRSF
jgi:putative tricarboxylic transport membrane protein